MAAENTKTQAALAAKLEKLETEMKTAFKEGRWEMVRKKADELLKADPKNRVAERVLQKTQEEEKTALKKAQTLKIVVLEAKMDQSFKAGNLDAMTKAMDELKKLDPTNAKVLKAEATIAKAKAGLEAEILKEKVRKLSAEVEFFANKADWNGAAAKANELLALEWDNPVALKALKKAASVKKVNFSSLITVQAPKVETKPGFFASLFGKKSEALVPAKALAPVPLKPTAAPVVAKITTPSIPVVKPVVQAETKPLTLQVKKTEAAKPVPAKEEVKTSFFGRLFSKTPETPAVAPKTSVNGSLKQTLKAVAAPAISKSEVSVLKPLVFPILQPVAPVKPAVEAKPVVPAPVPGVSKPSVFGALFDKNEEPKPVAAPAPAVLKPVVPMGMPVAAKPEVKPAPIVSAPVKSITPQLKVEQKAIAKPESKKPEKGNIFTSLFGKEEEAGAAGKPAVSVLETIVAKQAPGKNEPKKEKVPEERTGETFLKFASSFLQLAAVFILVSAAFLYVENIDQENRVLSFVGQENNAIQLHRAAQTLDGKKADVEALNTEISKYQGGYQDEHQAAIKGIVEGRMDWPAILKKLNEVTESVYEKNAISQYVQYNNYTYNTETGQLTVAGTLSDPLGKNLTKLAELEEAFRNYPKDPANPDDKSKPYFYGLQDFKSFSKSFNSSSGRFQSTFSLTLFTKASTK